MKKRVSIWFTWVLCLFMICVGFSACKDKPDDVVIVVENATQNQTLLSYMQQMQADGELSFTIQDGLVVEINGTANTLNSYWMLYTSDAENANNAWGTYDYDGVTLGSAIYGAEGLILKNGATYVWTYQTF